MPKLNLVLLEYPSRGRPVLARRMLHRQPPANIMRLLVALI
jgi:hypothetical protein